LIGSGGGTSISISSKIGQVTLFRYASKALHKYTLAYINQARDIQVYNVKKVCTVANGKRAFVPLAHQQRIWKPWYVTRSAKEPDGDEREKEKRGLGWSKVMYSFYLYLWLKILIDFCAAT